MTRAEPNLDRDETQGPGRRPPRRCGLDRPRSRPIARRASGSPGRLLSYHPSSPKQTGCEINQATLPIQHGGNPSAIRGRLGLGNRPLLDFSAPLNGLGPPRPAPSLRPAVDQSSTATRAGLPRLVARLAEYHGVPADRVIVGAGTTELIGLIGQSLRDGLPRARASRRPRPPRLAPGRADLRRVSPDLGPERAPDPGLGQHILGWAQDVTPRGRRRDLLDRPPQQPDRPGLGPRPPARLIDRNPAG